MKYKKYSKLFRKTLILAAFLISLTISMEMLAAEAPQNLSEDSDLTEGYMLRGSEKALLVDRIESFNTDWKSVQIDGKISLDFLPVKPSVKIFMEKGKCLYISARAPFFGEVARIEAVKDEVVVINKIKKTYFKADPGSLLETDPYLLAELQAIILGRIAIPGSGEFRSELAPLVRIVQVDEQNFLVIPEESLTDSVLKFGYSVSPLGSLEDVIAVYGGFDGYLDISYKRADDRLQITGELAGPKKTTSAILELDSPQWGVSGFGRMKIPSDYRAVSFREVIRMN